MPKAVREPVLQNLSSVSDTTAHTFMCVDKVGGDVGMFGYEDGEKLSERTQSTSFCIICLLLMIH